MQNLKKRVLRRVFVPKADEVTGIWGSYVLKSFIMCTFTKYFQVNQPNVGGRRGGWGACSTYEKGKNVHKLLGGKPGGKKKLEIHTWENNININLQDRDGKMYLELLGSGYGFVMVCC